MTSIVLHAVIVAIVPLSLALPPAGFLENARAICYTLATAGVLTSLYWTFVRLTPTTDAARFLTGLVIALALSETCSLAGLILYFIGHKAAEFWPFGMVALVIQGLFILPRAVKRD